VNAEMAHVAERHRGTGGVLGVTIGPSAQFGHSNVIVAAA
jgi:hypothetical protein